MAEAVGAFAGVVAERVIAEHRTLAARWLERLRPLLGVSPNDIFPSPTLLDHIPELIARIGGYLGTFDRADLEVSSEVVLKAQELGELRHAQRASAHQILQEYDLLGGILIAFIKEEIVRGGLSPSPAECIDVTNAVARAISVMRRATIDAFLTRYTDTITEQSKRLERFNRMLGHELQQPLAVMHNVAYLLKRIPAARTEDQFDMLERNVTRCVAITRQLEQIARIDATLDSPVTQQIDLTAAAALAARQLRELAEARGVKVRVEPGLPSVITEAARLELALVNLLSNAIKYSDPSKADRFVEVTSAEAPPGSCALTIRDNGIGIPPDRLAAIFGEFVRAHPERDAELAVRGMGLGLSIARDCLTAIGGTIHVESLEGAGTSFVVTLPMDCFSSVKAS